MDVVDTNIVITFIILFSMIAIAMYIMAIGYISAELALILFFGTMGLVFFIWLGIPEIRFRLRLRRYDKDMRLK